MPRIPKFLYFDEYYQMTGHENVPALIQRKTDNTLAASQYPRRGDNDHAGCGLQVNNGSGCSLLATHASHAAAIEWVPAIFDIDLLADMGRMTGRLLLDAANGCSPAPTVAVSERLQSTP
jgi:hypothetical protein